jgi:apolipoprotein D and lipocalin family protein
MNRKLFLALSALLVMALLSACQKIPEGAEVVTDFEKEKYLGTWYEMARLDHRFERNLSNVTAEYSLKEEGTIKVVNRGYDKEDQEWEQAEGKAKFRESENVGKLKVSFFGPFYGGYNILALDESYNYALVAGNDLDYLWILSRTPSIPKDVKSDYLDQAEKIGYDTDELIWVSHDRAEE